MGTQVHVTHRQIVLMQAAEAICPAWDLSKAAWSSGNRWEDGVLAGNGIHHPGRFTLPPVLGLIGVNLLLLIMK